MVYASYAQRVGIGTTTPATPLHIREGSSGATPFTFTRLTVESDNHTYINLLSPTNLETGILFGQPGSAGNGVILYDHVGTPNGFQFRTGGNVPRMAIDNNGRVGIGTLSPPFPLSFNQALGDKISLWNDGTPTHYGFGVQGSLLQVFAKSSIDNIGFGYGNSSSFTERMLIINSGEYGLSLNGRILLKNGTSPVDLNYGAGIWMLKPDNSGLLGFMGVQNGKNMGFYGGPLGWGFTYDAINSRVGIGNNNPNAPLSFPAALGKKITLYPGGTGDVGFGVSGNRLQIFADHPSADVAVGYDAAGTFHESFAFKPNGALAVNGNLGAPGQVLGSNGGNAALWSNVRPAFYSFKQVGYQIDMPYTGSSPGEPTGWYVIDGLHNQAVVLNQTSTVKMTVRLPIRNPSNAFGGIGTSAIYLGLYEPNNNYIGFDIVYVVVADGITDDGVVFNVRTDLPAGTYHSHVKVFRYGGDQCSTGTYYTGSDTGTLLVEIFPQ